MIVYRNSIPDISLSTSNFFSRTVMCICMLYSQRYFRQSVVSSLPLGTIVVYLDPVLSYIHYSCFNTVSLFSLLRRMWREYMEFWDTISFYPFIYMHFIDSPITRWRLHPEGMFFLDIVSITSVRYSQNNEGLWVTKE